MNVYYSETHRQHQPPFEVFDGGERIANFETPARMDRILSALQADGRFNLRQPDDFGEAPLLAVHDAGYLSFLKTAFVEWQHEASDYEKIALLPATFPPRTASKNIPTSLLGRAGYYTMDLSAPITAGTYPAAYASAQCALGAAQETAKSGKNTFALCRPPGHHAGKANCGGYCYINNAAVAANWLASKGKVALLDVDYHAGNGTQDIFYERVDVLSISIHGDPNEEYPYFNGFEDETGAGPGLGLHRNFPLAPGADDQAYLQALSEALGLVRDFHPQTLVVSAGMDIYGEDPLGKIRISTPGIAEIGRQIAGLGLPTVIVMEGGYNTEMLGLNMTSFLGAFHETE